MMTEILALLLAFSAHADEGLQRITELGDQDLVAQAKAKPKPAQPRYKSVDASESRGSDYFKGSPFPQTNNLFAGLGLNYFDAFGLQARYAGRVVDKGFVPDLNNSVYIEGGVGLTFYGSVKGKSVMGFGFMVAGRWDFQMDEMWTFFGTVGLGFNAVTEDMKWGNDLCFCVAGKMFAVVNIEPPPSIAFKCTPESFGELVERPGIIPAPYMARNMWVQEQELGDVLDRRELESLVKTSYELVVAKLPKSKRPGAARKSVVKGRPLPAHGDKRRTR